MEDRTVKHAHRSETYDPTEPVSGPLPFVLLDNGTDKYEAVDERFGGAVVWFVFFVVAMLTILAVAVLS